MKTTTNKKELIELDACCAANKNGDGLDRFVAAHGNNDVKLSEGLASNGWDDAWWLLDMAYEQFSDKQKKDLGLLGCNWAEEVLVNFESKYPNDDRPRKAIEMRRKCEEGKTPKEGLKIAREAAKIAEKEKEWAAAAAAMAAAMAAWRVKAWTTRITADWVARSTVNQKDSEEQWKKTREQQEADLMNLFLKWEKEHENY